MRTVALLAAMIAVGTVCPSGLTAGQPTTATIVTMLSAYESGPLREQWVALGDDAVPILVAIAADATQMSFRRARALTVLGYFSDARAQNALATVASDAAARGPFRRAALLALAKRDLPHALPIVEQVLAGADPLMRQVAVKALAESASLEARQVLERHKSRERERFLVEAIESALMRPTD